MLNIVEKALPIRNNECSIVVQRYSTSVKIYGRASRDIDWLKRKFEKLENNKKPAGDFSCPPDGRRAKHIATHILNRVGEETEVSSSRKLMKATNIKKSMVNMA